MNVYSIMKKFFIGLALFLSSLQANAENRVSLNSVSCRPGEEAELIVSLNNTNAVTAVQIDLPLNGYITYVNGSAQLSSARSNGHSLSASTNGNTLSVLIYPSSVSSLKGNTGDLVRFRIRAGKEPCAYNLSPNVVLSDANGQALPCQINSGKITILAPKLEILNGELDFGYVPIMGTYRQNLTLKNVGTEKLNITGISFSKGPFETSEHTFSIDAGQTKDVSVTYKPTERGVVTGMLTVTSNSINGMQEIEMKANAFSMNELHVKGASGKSDEEVSIEVSMNNMEPIVAAQLSFILPDELQYVEESAVLSADRSDGHRIKISLDDNKLTFYVYSGSMKPLKGTNGMLVSFRLKLNGKSGSYSVTPVEVALGNSKAENMTSNVYGDIVLIQSPSIHCQSMVDMGQTPVTKEAISSFTIENSGQVPLQVSAITFLDEGFSVRHNLPFVIQPGQSENMEIAYIGNKTGSYFTTMNIYSDDPENRMIPVTVKGELYSPNKLSINGSSVSNGYVLHVALSNHSPIASLQMDIHWIEGMTTSTGNLTLSNRFSKMDYKVARLNETTYRFIFYNMDGSIVPQGEGEIFSVKYESDDESAYIGGTISVDNIVMSDNSTENVASQTTVYHQLSKIVGDINGDGTVNITDLTCLVNVLMKKVQIEDDVFGVADINHDKKVDITDLTCLVNIMCTK